MAKGFFIVYCLQTLRQPKLYKLEHFATKLCQTTPHMQCQSFPDEKHAKQFLQDQLYLFRHAEKQKVMAIIQNNLTAPTPLQPTPPKPTDKPEEKAESAKEAVETISPEMRLQREGEVGKLFTEQRMFKEISFKSTLSQVDRGVRYLGYFDGCSKSNPGLSGAGYHIDHPITRTTIISRSEFVGVKRTNNQAELIALNLLLADAYCNDITMMTVFGDSELAIKFMRGEYKTSNEFLKAYVKAAFWLAKKFQLVEFEHIRRNYNTKADKLSNQALKIRKQPATSALDTSTTLEAPKKD